MRSVLPFTFASLKTSSACDGWRTCCSTKRSATCLSFIVDVRMASTHVWGAQLLSFGVAESRRGFEIARSLRANRDLLRARRPPRTLRTPSSRKVRMPSSRARWRSDQGRAAFVDHVPHFVVDDEDFENAHAPFVAGLRGIGRSRPVSSPALRAIAPARCRSARNSVSLNSPGCFAIRAESPNESLRHDRAHGGGDEKRLHADVDQARDGGRRVVRVQRAENKVTGQAGVDRDRSLSRDREFHRS